MIIYNSLEQLNIHDRTAIAIGKFDGVHRGHRLLLDRIIQMKEYGYKSLVFTFNPSPAVFFGGVNEMLITTDQEKYRIFEGLGIDILVEYELNRKSASIMPEDFIRNILVDRLNCGYIVAGDDLSYGHMGKGDFDLLEKCAYEYGFDTEKIDKIKINDKTVSSTIIKDMILKGKIKDAANMLGKPYFISGVVTAGKQLGRTIGFPTINIVPPSGKILPLYGVYFSKVYIDNQLYYGITNIGIKPTVTDEMKPVSETFIFDFNQDVYGKDIIVEFVDFKRPERKFDSLEQLKEALESDIREAKRYFCI